MKTEVHFKRRKTMACSERKISANHLTQLFPASVFVSWKHIQILFSDTYFSVKTIVLPFPGAAWIPHSCGHSAAAVAAAFLMRAPSTVPKKPELAQAWQWTQNGLLSASQSYYILNFLPSLSYKCNMYFQHCTGTMGLIPLNEKHVNVRLSL